MWAASPVSPPDAVAPLKPRSFRAVLPALTPVLPGPSHGTGEQHSCVSEGYLPRFRPGLFLETAMRYALIILTALVLAGCATTQPSYDLMALEQQRLERLDQVALTCESDLCRVMVAQEQGRNQYRPAPQGHHPAWSILDRTLAIAVPAYFGARQVRDLVGLTGDVAGVIAGMDRSDNSITIGGDQIGGDRVDDQSVAVGGDQIGGDRVDDQSVGGDQIGGDNRVGDDISGCVGDECRVTSPGPIDESDNSDNSDNSTTNPPPAP